MIFDLMIFDMLWYVPSCQPLMYVLILHNFWEWLSDTPWNCFFAGFSMSWISTFWLILPWTVLNCLGSMYFTIVCWGEGVFSCEHGRTLNVALRYQLISILICLLYLHNNNWNVLSIPLDKFKRKPRETPGKGIWSYESWIILYPPGN